MKAKTRSIIRSLIYVLFLSVVFLLQSTVLARVFNGGTKPLLLPLAVAAIALSDGSLKGGAFGVVAGVLCDISFNQPTMQFTLCLTIIGIGIGLIAEAFLVKNLITYVICSVISLVFCALWQSTPYLLFRGVSFSVLFSISVRQLLLSIIFTLPIYYFFRLINHSVRGL